jgi:pimeloyl-ACP methyl ester carboxylesterase
MIPIFILQIWLLGLFSLGVIGGAAYLAHEWQQRSWAWDPALQQSVFSPRFGWNEETAILAAAILLALLALAGGPLIKAILRLTKGKRAGADADGDPRVSPPPASQQRLRRPDGSELQVEFYGPEDGAPIVLTHGWGLHGGEWNYLKRELSDRFRLIVWDEPGLGRSTRPTNRDYSIENLARDLEAVLALAGDKPAILLGHSIGGMIILTFCRLFPEALGSRVAGLVLTHTTPTNPVRTTSGATFYTAIEKPVLVPLMYLTIALSPLLWLMNWLSYRNGSAHLSTKRGSFGGTETWEQIDFATSFQPQASPAVLARGMLGMMRYDATETLAGISVPALVVAGDQDATTKPEASESIRAGIPDARLITLAPAKHLGLIEHHTRYAEAVREFAVSAQARAQEMAA